MVEAFHRRPIVQTVDILLHGVDFLMHKLKHAQIGSFGLTSKYSEKIDRVIDLTSVGNMTRITPPLLGQ